MNTQQGEMHRVFICSVKLQTPMVAFFEKSHTHTHLSRPPSSGGFSKKFCRNWTNSCKNSLKFSRSGVQIERNLGVGSVGCDLTPHFGNQASVVATFFSQWQRPMQPLCYLCEKVLRFYRDNFFYLITLNIVNAISLFSRWAIHLNYLWSNYLPHFLLL